MNPAGHDAYERAAARRDEVRHRLAAEGADALLVTDLVHVRYLTGFTGSVGALLLGARPEDDHFATDERYRLQAEQEVGGLPTTITRGREWLPAAVPEGTTLALEARRISWAEATALSELLGGRRVVPIDGVVEAARQLKDPAELEALRRACELISDALLATLDHVRPGRTEREIAAHLEATMLRLGAEAPAFPSIVASGPNGARPHHRPGDRRLERGDVITVDAGACVDGYRSDMTRVLSLGEPAGPLAAVLEVVAAAQRAGLSAARDGVTAGEVDAACRGVVAEAGLGDRFVHGTGHGIGLEVHEAPLLSSGASDTLRSRMVVTIEPGVYLPGLGGARIEDTVLVGAEGVDILTPAPSQVFVL